MQTDGIVYSAVQIDFAGFGTQPVRNEYDICLIELFSKGTDLFNISVHLPLFVKDNDVLTYFQPDTNCNGILVVLGINHLDIFELAEFAQKILVLSYIKQKGHADLLNDFLNSYF